MDGLKKYQVLWADDDWQLPDEEPAKRLLTRAMNEIEGEQRKSSISVAWTTRFRAAEAAEEARNLARDFRLVIVDYRFQGDEYSWNSVLRAARNRGIPFILYSGFLGDAMLHPDFPKDDPLFLGMYPKSMEGQAQLVHRVAAFFRAPPFRILHLTDFHYDSSASGADAELQTHLFRQLPVALKMEHAERPIDAIVMTGDFAYHNPAADLVAVRSHVKAIINATTGDNDPERFLMVPGNHDLTWDSFAEKKISANPWACYLDFYQAIYPGRSDVLMRMPAWDPAARLLDHKARRDRLIWSARMSDIPVHFVGLVSSIDTGDEQGKGHISEEQMSYIRECWSGDPPFGELRIALTHHNVFGVLSYSPHDEKGIILNAGEVMLNLMRSSCSLVLSGHTHTTNLMSCSAAHSRRDRLVTTGTLTALSAGTLGGFHGAKDRQRSFNVLEFGQADVATGKRALGVRTFCFDTVERVWQAPDSYYMNPLIKV